MINKAAEMSKSTRLRRGLLISWATCVVSGLGACVASDLIPNPNPNESFSTNNGMHLWESIDKRYSYGVKPSWCIQESALGDGAYSEVNCFMPLGGSDPSFKYQRLHCVFDEPDEPTSCNKEDIRSYTSGERGKLMRFYGDQKLLKEEELLMSLRGNASAAGMFLFWGASSMLMGLWALLSITTNNWKL